MNPWIRCRGGAGVSLAAIAAMLLIAASSVRAQVTAAPGGFAGRVAVGSDGCCVKGTPGPSADADDVGAAPWSIAILAAGGAKLVHHDYCNYITNNPAHIDQEMVQKMIAGVEGAERRFYPGQKRTFNCQTELDAAIANLKQEILKSSEDDRLYYLAGGPLEVFYRAAVALDPAERHRLGFVTIISHHKSNHGWSPDPEDEHRNIDDILAINPGTDHDPKFETIPNQNRRLASREAAVLDWMQDHEHEPFRFLHERRLAGRRNDISDAGMAYYLVTGDKEPDYPKLSAFFQAHFEGSDGGAAEQASPESPSAASPLPPPNLPAGAGPDVLFEEVDGVVVVEAEHFYRQSADDVRRWYLTTRDQSPVVEPDGDPNHAGKASGGAYMELLPDTRRTHDDRSITGVNFRDRPDPPMAVLHYRVYIHTPGRYYVWARVFATTTEDNGMHVGIDGQWPKTGHRMQFGRGTWRWGCHQRTAKKHSGVLNQIYLDIDQPGEYEIMFSMREDGIEFDKWMLTLQRLESVEGAGPEASPRRPDSDVQDADRSTAQDEGVLR